MHSVSLRSVEKGMKVHDRDNQEIGRVDWVRFGDDDPETPEIEANAGAEVPRRDTLIDAIADVFRPDDLPEEVRQRLLHQGFVRIDADGLFAADRYVTPEQIGSVNRDGITLNVSRDDLLKRP
ncbi:MAG: hypothetical protein IPK28_11985 [Devosia sp.]|nr:hypothetical protein [Devosia sp.]